MELFGAQGFKATTIAQIEAAAGLSPGAGGLYRHFASKRALLEEGLRRQFADGAQLLSFIEDPALLRTGDLHGQLVGVARAGLRRLEQERDVNRLLVRDLRDFPDLLEAFRQQELQRVYGVLTGWLGGLAGAGTHAPPGQQATSGAEPAQQVRSGAGRAELAGQPAAVDIEALAAVLVSALSHYWLLVDVFGSHPLGLDEDRYLEGLADVAARALSGPLPPMG